MARSSLRNKSKKIPNYRKVSTRQDSILERRLDRDDKLLDSAKAKAILAAPDDEDKQPPPPSTTASNNIMDPSSILSPELQESLGDDAVMAPRQKQKKKKREVEVRCFLLCPRFTHTHTHIHMLMRFILTYRPLIPPSLPPRK